MRYLIVMFFLLLTVSLASAQENTNLRHCTLTELQTVYELYLTPEFSSWQQEITAEPVHPRYRLNATNNFYNFWQEFSEGLPDCSLTDKFDSAMREALLTFQLYLFYRAAESNTVSLDYLARYEDSIGAVWNMMFEASYEIDQDFNLNLEEFLADSTT